MRSQGYKHHFRLERSDERGPTSSTPYEYTQPPALDLADNTYNKTTIISHGSFLHHTFKPIVLYLRAMLKLNFPHQITKATHICFALMCLCCQGRPTTLPAQRLARNRIAKRNCAQQRCLGPQSPDALIRLYARRLPVCVCGALGGPASPPQPFGNHC